MHILPFTETENHIDRIGAMVYGMDDGVISKSLNGMIESWNLGAETIFGYTKDEVIGRSIAMLIPPGHQEEEAFLLEKLTLGNSIPQYETVGLHKSGSLIHLSATISPIKDNSGKVIAASKVVRAISSRQLSEGELKVPQLGTSKLLEELNYLKFALDQHAIVAMTDLQGTITYVNAKFVEISGYAQEELLGQNHRKLNSGTHSKQFFTDMYETISRGGVWHGEICNIAKSGKTYWVLTTIVPFIDGNGLPVKYIAIRADITEQKMMEAQIRCLAYSDALTNLPNRRMLMDRLEHALSLSHRSKRYGAVMFMDLDKFKSLNDQYGHDVGDLLLIEVARRLMYCVRKIDTVARFGGDEFVILLSELDTDKLAATSQVHLVAEKILAALSATYILEIRNEGQRSSTVEHRCTASMGVAMFDNHEGSPDNILKWADAAMYQAKESGRNQLRFHEL